MEYPNIEKVIIKKSQDIKILAEAVREAVKSEEKFEEPQNIIEKFIVYCRNFHKDGSSVDRIKEIVRNELKAGKWDC